MKSNLLREYDVDLLGLLRIFKTSFELRAVDRVFSATFRRDLLLQLLNPYHIMAAVTALQAAAQLEVARPIFVSCVMSIYLSIDLSVHFSPSLVAAATVAGFVCYSAAIILAATS